MRIEEGIIASACEYFKNVHQVGDDELEDVIDFSETGDDRFPVSMDEYNLVADIIALQLSYFCLIRVTHSCESNTDAVYSMLNKKYIEYSNKLGKDFNNLNSGKLA